MKLNKIIFIDYPNFPFGISAAQNKLRFMVQCIISANYFTEIYSLNKNKPISNRFKGFYKNVRFVFFGKKNTNFLISYFTSFFKELLFLKRKSNQKKQKIIIIHYTWFPLLLYYRIISLILGYKLIIHIMEWHVSIKTNKLIKRFNDFLFDYFSFLIADGAIVITHFIQKKVNNLNKSLPIYVLPAITDFKIFQKINSNPK